MTAGSLTLALILPFAALAEARPRVSLVNSCQPPK